MTYVLPEFYLGDLRLDDYPYAVLREDDGVDLGSAENVMSTVESLLVDGDLVLSTHTSNRTLSISLLVEGADLRELAENEAALGLECDKDFNSFTLNPGDDFGPSTVFRTFKAQAVHTRDDRHESALVRRWDLTIPAAPRGYSASEVVIDAEVVPVDGGGTPVAPIDLLVDDCSSATNWTTTHGAVSATVSPGILWTTTAQNPAVLRRYGAVTMTGTSLLAVQLRADTPGGVLSAQFYNSAGAIYDVEYPIAGGKTASTSFTWYYFKAPSTAWASMSFQVSYLDNINKVGKLGIGEIRRRNNPPATGTLRQKFFTAEVPGSAPSQGTVEISHATSGLGSAIVYTSPGDSGQQFVPALRPFLYSSGPTTPDTSLVSGGRENIGTADIYRLPAALVAPGTYELGAIMRCSSTGAQAISVGRSMRDAAGNLIGSAAFTTVSVAFAAANTWAYLPLGRYQLPGLRVSATTSAQVQVSVQATSGLVDLDESYLFDVDHGALTRVEVGTKTRLWLKAATVTDPTPSILVGTQADESDAVAADGNVVAWGVHETTPSSTNIFVVTPTALDVNARLRLTPAWHTHAAR